MFEEEVGLPLERGSEIVLLRKVIEGLRIEVGPHDRSRLVS